MPFLPFGSIKSKLRLMPMIITVLKHRGKFTRNLSIQSMMKTLGQLLITYHYLLKFKENSQADQKPKEKSNQMKIMRTQANLKEMEPLLHVQDMDKRVTI
ncbi:hypothetical protein REPUB_Repub16aG0120000 [Reevesia pubescens]